MLAPIYLYYLFHGFKGEFADGFPNGSVISFQVKFAKNLNKAGFFHLKRKIINKTVNDMLRNLTI